jgi:hypothetical protein
LQTSQKRLTWPNAPAGSVFSFAVAEFLHHSTAVALPTFGESLKLIGIWLRGKHRPVSLKRQIAEARLVAEIAAELEEVEPKLRNYLLHFLERRSRNS